jgi:ribonuclease BN (tRNA processing enzyme)
MRITIVGSGDAFGTNGRAHSCIRIDANQRAILVDFGASSIASYKRLGLRLNDIDAIVISHLHGDHFGGVPFFLLDSQFSAQRREPLTVAGPLGSRLRIETALDTLFANSSHIHWSFPWNVEEYEPQTCFELAGFAVKTFKVEHLAAGVATGIRLDDGEHIFAFSGDSAWTENLLALSANADIFVMECYSGRDIVPNHMDWGTLRQKLGAFSAKKIILTHMNESALACRKEMEEAGLSLAHDGLSLEI